MDSWYFRCTITDDSGTESGCNDARRVLWAGFVPANNGLEARQERPPAIGKPSHLAKQFSARYAEASFEQKWAMDRERGRLEERRVGFW